MKLWMIFVGGLILAVAGILAIAYFALPHSGEAEENTLEGFDDTPGYTIEAVGEDITKIMPNVDRGVTFSASVPSEVRTLINSKVAEIVARLKADPLRSADWFNLGILYHSANDFQGEKEVWEFLIKVAPTDSTSYENLGKLHHFSIPDFPKAELNFKKAITLNPESINSYLELFQLYKYSYKVETSASIDILKEAATKFPKNPDPYHLIGLEYRDRNDTANARVYLTKAIDIARAIGNLDLVQAIGDELAKLPQ